MKVSMFVSFMYDMISSTQGNPKIKHIYTCLTYHSHIYEPHYIRTLNKLNKYLYIYI